MGHFKGIYSNTPIDRENIDQNLLNITNKYKSNPLPWNGQFSPQLVQVLLNYYSNKTDIVFDPFLGSGTTLLEAGELKRQAYGTEINYAAICLSKIYELINVDFYKNNFSEKWLEMKWYKIKSLIKALPVSTNTIKILQEDARETSFQDSQINFIVTSPPYINVFNYHQQYRSSSEHLNGSVLPIAKAEIGSNRKNRSNRFNTVTQYCIDMGMVFNEINRICQDGSHIIFILGRESQVKKTSFFNGEIVSEIAYECNNMKLTNRQERVFINRYGVHIYEDILHFNSTKKKNINNIELAKNVAKNILISVKKNAPDESQADLKDALNKIEEVQPSEIFRR